MGLYIPNAKIPVSCNKCYEIGLAHRLRDLGGHCPRMDLHYSPDEQAFKGDRRVDCHLLDVPPHGRLIDADALLMRINHEVMEAYMDGACYGVHPSQEYLYILGEIIDEAPAVIPASEGGE